MLENGKLAEFFAVLSNSLNSLKQWYHKRCFSPVPYDFGELYSVFVACIVGVHVTLSYDVQRMSQLSINTNYICMHIYIDDKIQPSKTFKASGLLAT